MNRILVLLLSVLLLSCGTGRITKTTGTKPTETIIFGRLVLNSEKPLNVRKILLHFNERLWGKYAVWPDDSGYFYMKMPLGNNHIALLEYRDGAGFFKNIPEGYCSVNLSAPDKICYVGNITFDWTPDSKDARDHQPGAAGGAAGALRDARQEGSQIPVAIESDEATIAYFRRKFPDNKKEIITQLMTLRK